VPERSSDVWADRKTLLNDLNVLLKDSQERERSSITIIWGYIGAGKSHSLFHLKRLVEKHSESLFILAPMPKEIKKFADLYQYGFFKPLSFVTLARVAADIWGKLSEGLGPKNELETLEKISTEIAGGWVDFAQAIASLGRMVSLTGSIRDPICLSVESWLSGARLSKSELKSLGVSGSLREESDFVRATSSIIRLLTYRKNGCKGFKKVFWTLDDSHYLASLKNSPKAFNQIQQGLRDCFDACPNNVYLILSFAASDASKLDELLVEDLTSRVSRRIQVPPLNDEDAFSFVTELINLSDSKKEGITDYYYPYTKESIERIIKLCKQMTDLTPRNLMKLFEKITEKAEAEIDSVMITVGYVNNFIKDNDSKVDFS
jgi:hypothetical protein